ncbi:hypothetical protein B296_00048817 [Ensete ventricosum]|uniref:Uncharacterized protein n=1 Tax=Ensete ventricosum TaxID=4639 RepID=A0A426YTA6_ENSVE|nr:hypothetical protein B296_00048817 [Ensete ventricosum]
MSRLGEVTCVCKVASVVLRRDSTISTLGLLRADRPITSDLSCCQPLTVRGVVGWSVRWRVRSAMPSVVLSLAVRSLRID